MSIIYIMSNKSTKILNVLISLGGLFLLGVCLIVFIKEELVTTNAAVTIVLLAQILLGAFIINTAIILTRKAYQLFLGFMIAGWGIVLYLMEFVLPYTIYQMWPVFLVISGLFLLITGIYKYQTFKFGYGIPAAVLFCLGIYFMLFSFKIIKLSFSVVATVMGPFFMLLVAVSLVIFFFAQQKHSELIVNDDNRGDFEDEELDPSRFGK